MQRHKGGENIKPIKCDLPTNLRAQPDEPPVRCAECANYQTQNCGAKMDKEDEI